MVESLCYDEEHIDDIMVDSVIDPSIQTHPKTHILHVPTLNMSCAGGGVDATFMYGLELQPCDVCPLNGADS